MQLSDDNPTQCIVVQISDDNVAEETETFNIALATPERERGEPGSVTLNTKSMQVTVQDNDNGGKLSSYHTVDTS